MLKMICDWLLSHWLPHCHQCELQLKAFLLFCLLKQIIGRCRLADGRLSADNRCTSNNNVHGTFGGKINIVTLQHESFVRFSVTLKYMILIGHFCKILFSFTGKYVCTPVLFFIETTAWIQVKICDDRCVLGVGSNNDGILVLGATNIPWVLDAAIRRRWVLTTGMFSIRLLGLYRIF